MALESKEFTLEQDCELRFEIESKNEKVKLEVSKLAIEQTIYNLRKTHCNSPKHFPGSLRTR